MRIFSLRGLLHGLLNLAEVHMNDKRRLLQSDPVGYLAWVNARSGILGIRLLDDPHDELEFWESAIGSGRSGTPEYHWQRVYGCAMGEVIAVALGVGAAGAVGLWSLSAAWTAAAAVPILGFMLLLTWHGGWWLFKLDRACGVVASLT